MAIRHSDSPLLMDGTNGAHNGHADDAACYYYGENDKAHDALSVD